MPKPDPTPNQPSPASVDIELTFEQQQEIDRLGKLAYTPSSNSNKYRYDLYAYINAAVAEAVRAAEVRGASKAAEAINGELGLTLTTNGRHYLSRYAALKADRP